MAIEINIEDLLHCPDEISLGGLRARIWYAPLSFFSKINLPTQGNFVEKKKISKEDIALKQGKSLGFIDAFLEQNALTEKVKGTQRKWKTVSELSFSLLGMKLENLGFIQTIKNEPLIFFIPDNNENIWLFGSLKNPAYLNTYEANTNKKTEEDPLLNISFIAQTELLKYEGKIEEI